MNSETSDARGHNNDVGEVKLGRTLGGIKVIFNHQGGPTMMLELVSP